MKPLPQLIGADDRESASKGIEQNTAESDKETGARCAGSSLPRRRADKSRTSDRGLGQGRRLGPQPEGTPGQARRRRASGQGGRHGCGLAAPHTGSQRSATAGRHREALAPRGRACTPSQPAADAAENKGAGKQDFSDQEIVVTGTSKDIPKKQGSPEGIREHRLGEAHAGRGGGGRVAPARPQPRDPGQSRTAPRSWGMRTLTPQQVPAEPTMSGRAARKVVLCL